MSNSSFAGDSNNGNPCLSEGENPRFKALISMTKSYYCNTNCYFHKPQTQPISS
jgi:hypothetical protein